MERVVGGLTVQNGSVLLADLVDALGRATEVPRRADKVNRLAGLLRRTPVEDVERVVALLTGVLRPVHDGSEWAETFASAGPPADTSTLTVAELGAVAAEIAGTTGAQAPEGLASSIARLLERATSEERVAIRSMLDPDREPPVSDSVMSSAIGRAAAVRVGVVRHAASLNGSLPLTASLALLQGESALSAVAVRAGHPIQPMVAVPVDDLDEIDFGAICIEWAPTGLRLQAHRAGRSVSLFVHDGVTQVDVTEALDELTEFVRYLPGEDLVLDGELSGTEIPDPSIDESARRARFSDVLFNGEPLLELPLRSRRRALATLVPEQHRVPSLESADPDDAVRVLEQARSNGRVGVVLKDLDSTYEPGRRARSWRLVAPVRTLDLVVVAAEWGSGRRSDQLSRLHLAATTADGGFEVVGRTALGVTDDMLQWQTERLLQHADGPVDRESVVRVRPELVVEVAFDSVRRPRSGGLSLRSARVRRYREDLGPDDADSVETVTALLPQREDDLDERRSRPSPGDTRHPGRRADDVEREAVDADDEAPRLPPALPPTLDAAQTEAAKRIREVLAAEHPVVPEPERPADADDPGTLPIPAGLPVSGYLRGHVASADLDFAPYEEPELETGRRAHAFVMLARFVSLGWVVAVTTAAFITRSDPGSVDASLVRNIGWFGVAVVAALAVTGWAWSDRLTRNLRRLDGRLPSRLRCVTGWLVPVATVVLLAITIVRLEPTEVVDVRPAIIAAIFASVVWRPYSLVRRILATLIRLRSDALLAAGYVLDLVAFGLLWWRLTVWGDGAELSRGDVDIMVGIGAAVSVAMAANVLVWRAIVRAGDRAEAHRASSQRTRYEHRMLRLRGVDPTDPEVWWALVQRRADEQRAEEQRIAAEREAEARAADGSEPAVPAPTVVPTVDELVDSVKQRHSVAFRRLGDEQSGELEQRLREQFSTVVGDLGGLPLTGPAPAPATDDRLDEHPAGEQPDGDGAEGVPAGDVLTEPPPAQPPVGTPDASPISADRSFSILKALAERDVGAPVADDEPADVAAAESPADAPPATEDVAEETETAAVGDVAAESDAAAEAAAATDGLSPLERLAIRTAESGERAAPRADALRDRLEAAAASTGEVDPVSALRRRLGLDETVEDVKSPLEQLLGQAGTVQVEAALAERRQQELDERPTERLVPPRLYALEWARLLLVTAFAIVTAASAWMLTETLGSGGSSDGAIGLDALDVDLARRAFVGAYSVAIALIPLWTFLVLTYARRCGMVDARPRIHLGLFAMAVALCTVAFVVDGGTRGGTSALLLIPGAIIAAAAGYLVEPARYWFELPSVTLTIWTVAVPVTLGLAWVGGLVGRVGESASLQVLAFFTVCTALLSALVTVLVALSAADIEDEIRLSPELAVPLGRSRRRRS